MFSAHSFLKKWISGIYNHLGRKELFAKLSASTKCEGNHIFHQPQWNKISLCLCTKSLQEKSSQRWILKKNDKKKKVSGKRKTWRTRIGTDCHGEKLSLISTSAWWHIISQSKGILSNSLLTEVINKTQLSPWSLNSCSHLLQFLTILYFFFYSILSIDASSLDKCRQPLLSSTTKLLFYLLDKVFSAFLQQFLSFLNFLFIQKYQCPNSQMEFCWVLEQATADSTVL